MSPSLHREKGYRFFFFSEERQETPHIHVEKVGKIAKIWLDPVEVTKNYGFTNKDNEIYINSSQTTSKRISGEME